MEVSGRDCTATARLRAHSRVWRTHCVRALAVAQRATATS